MKSSLMWSHLECIRFLTLLCFVSKNLKFIKMFKNFPNKVNHTLFNKAKTRICKRSILYWLENIQSCNMLKRIIPRKFHNKVLVQRSSFLYASCLFPLLRLLPPNKMLQVQRIKRDNQKYICSKYRMSI